MQHASLSLSIDADSIDIDYIVLDIGYTKGQNSLVMSQELARPCSLWLVLGKAFHAAAKYLYAGLRETGIDDTDFRILESTPQQRALACEYDRPKGAPYARLDQCGPSTACWIEAW